MRLLEESKQKKKLAIFTKRMPLLYFLGDFRAGTFFFLQKSMFKHLDLQTTTAWLSQFA